MAIFIHDVIIGYNGAKFFGEPTTKLPLYDDYRTIALKRLPLIDLRAPIEFAKGSFPNAVNLPLMTDSERAAVGTVYKRHGNEAAVKLGHQLVSGEVKAARITKWVDFLRNHPDALIFCWRGGQRSEIVQRWIYESAGIVVPRIEKGYKAFRNYLIDATENAAQSRNIYLLGGRTGSGKTLLLPRFAQSVDLEGLANHRGSAFGRYAAPQPPQIGFENTLAYELIDRQAKGFDSLLLEDESRMIGHIHIPYPLFTAMQQRGKLVLLERPLQERIEIAYRDYILFGQKDYDTAQTQGDAPHGWIETMRHNFDRIKKRLGGERHKHFRQMLDVAWEHQQKSGDSTRHKEWIEALLRDYYDPMYDYQLQQRKEQIVFRGDEKAVVQFLKEKLN